MHHQPPTAKDERRRLTIIVAAIANANAAILFSSHRGIWQKRRIMKANNERRGEYFEVRCFMPRLRQS